MGEDAALNLKTTVLIVYMGIHLEKGRDLCESVCRTKKNLAWDSLQALSTFLHRTETWADIQVWSLWLPMSINTLRDPE